MTKILNNSLVVLLKAFAQLPFGAIYLISDFLYLVLFYVVGYRKRVVYTNLRKSFPEKTEAEIDHIARQFYRHFCDLTLEAIKLYRMTDAQLDERITVKGLEKANAYCLEGKSIILLGMHYNNWEWSASLQRIAKHQLLMIYNPVRDNQEMERFILDMRERFGGISVPVNHSARTAIQFGKGGRPGCLWLAADQTPAPTTQFWTTFLNQETPFFSGPEKIAVKTNQPVFFHHTRKTGRGKYEVNFIELFAEPSKESGETILMKYVETMENIIRETPQYWLWSHRRWKHQRPEHTPLIPRTVYNG